MSEGKREGSLPDVGRFSSDSRGRDDAEIQQPAGPGRQAATRSRRTIAHYRLSITEANQMDHFRSCCYQPGSSV